MTSQVSYNIQTILWTTQLSTTIPNILKGQVLSSLSMALVSLKSTNTSWEEKNLLFCLMILLSLEIGLVRIVKALILKWLCVLQKFSKERNPQYYKSSNKEVCRKSNSLKRYLKLMKVMKMMKIRSANMKWSMLSWLGTVQTQTNWCTLKFFRSLHPSSAPSLSCSPWQFPLSVQLNSLELNASTITNPKTFVPIKLTLL